MENLSKNQIRKIGDKIRESYLNIPEDILKGLQKYRTTFKDTLSEIFTEITNESKRIYTESITSYRIKRIDSIIRKLSRIKGMELDRMWDIAGCRCIFKNEKHILKLEKFIRNNYYVIESQTRDYYKNKLETGYRSYHLYIRKHKEDSFTIEIQLRTVEDHNWATLVEITDLLFEDNAKEANDINSSKFGKFHYLLSKKEQRTNFEKKEIIEIVNGYEIYKKLSSIFIKNYIEVRSQWEMNNIHKNKSYFIIESQKDSPPIISSFQIYDLAEEEYFKRFLHNNRANILLTYLSSVNFKKISIAYSNYILTMHSFLDDYISLLEEMIIYAVERKKLDAFKKYYSIYLETMVTHHNELNEENKEIKRVSINSPNQRNCRFWKDELNQRYQSILTNQKRFIKKVGSVYPKTLIYSYFFRNAIKSIDKKYLTKTNNN